MNQDLKIVSIASTVDGVSRVILDNTCFVAANKKRPDVPFKDAGWTKAYGEADSDRVRVLNFNGVEVTSLWNEADKTRFFMNAAEAAKHLYAAPTAKLSFNPASFK